MDEAAKARLRDESLGTSWLAARLGVDARRLDALRRAGELLGVRPDGADDWAFPSWQFDAAGRPRPVVARAVREARARGTTDERLYEILTMRRGLAGDERLVDALRAGRDEDVLRGLRESGR